MDRIIAVVGWILVVACGLCVVGLLVALPSIIEAERQERAAWALWAANHCKVVGRRDSYTTTGMGTGLSSSGKLVTVTTFDTVPAQVGYECDDGVTYWKNQ